MQLLPPLPTHTLQAQRTDYTPATASPAMALTGLGEPFHCGEVTSTQLRLGFAQDQTTLVLTLAASLCFGTMARAGRRLR